MKKLFLVLNILIFSFINLNAQYINKIYEYVPAPGQFTNNPTMGTMESAESLIGTLKGAVSLGAFGGYIVFGFENSVINHPDNPYGIDFIIYGNPLSTWSEPGIVYVMKDENNNGLPDDTWYEIAGSDYYFSNTIKDYSVTYANPYGYEAHDVPWADIFWNEGYIYANEYHNQPYYPLPKYFPNINQERYTLTGTKIQGCLDKTDPIGITSSRRAFGYADNTPKAPSVLEDNVPDNPYTIDTLENSGADGIDISWAIDKDGNYVNLDKIDFIKVQCGMLADAGWLGEVSTELRGAVVVEPNSSISGVMDMAYIQDVPYINYSPYQLEAVAFRNGRIIDEPLVWKLESDDSSVSLSNDGVITYDSNVDNETIRITVYWENNPEIKHTITTKILDIASINDYYTSKTNKDILSIYPNPSSDYITIDCGDVSDKEIEVFIYSIIGHKVLQTRCNNGDNLDITTLEKGVYIVNCKIMDNSSGKYNSDDKRNYKILKQKLVKR